MQTVLAPQRAAKQAPAQRSVFCVFSSFSYDCGFADPAPDSSPGPDTYLDFPGSDSSSVHHSDSSPAVARSGSSPAADHSDNSPAAVRFDSSPAAIRSDSSRPVPDGTAAVPVRFRSTLLPPDYGTGTLLPAARCPVAGVSVPIRRVFPPNRYLWTCVFSSLPYILPFLLLQLIL